MAQSKFSGVQAYLKSRQDQKVQQRLEPDESAKVLKLLAQAEMSTSSLMAKSGISFEQLARLLDRLQDYHLVRRKEGAEGTLFELTEDGLKATEID